MYKNDTFECDFTDKKTGVHYYADVDYAFELSFQRGCPYADEMDVDCRITELRLFNVYDKVIPTNFYTYDHIRQLPDNLLEILTNEIIDYELHNRHDDIEPDPDEGRDDREGDDL